LILLSTRSFDALRPIGQDDSQRIIECDCAGLHGTNRIPFKFLLRELGSGDAISAQLRCLEALEESLIQALHLLHSHNISFPVSVEDIGFSRDWREDWGNFKSLKLFLDYNEKACWASAKLPPTWKADQLSNARSIFFVPKVRHPDPALSSPWRLVNLVLNP
jgi:hypothetical protein